jgi:hypothetical protein
MFDILQALKDGQSADDIAASFTTALNEAISTYNKEQEETQKKTQKLLEKNEAAWKIYTSIINYYETYYPNYGITTAEYVDKIDKDSLTKIVISTLEIPSFDDILKLDDILELFEKVF